MKHLSKLFILLILIIFTSSCGSLLHPFGGLFDDDNDDEDNNSDSLPEISEVEATGTYKLAIGGNATGRDELVLFDASGNPQDLSGSTLEFRVDKDILSFSTREGYSTFADGSGAKIIPLKPGYAVVTYLIDNKVQPNDYLVIIPPQSIIQMLVSEASTQIYDEATLNNNEAVALDSRSTTAESLAFVTRNRVELTQITENFDLFCVNNDAWNEDPTKSYFDAVISAYCIEGIYQYSPVDPNDGAHATYLDAALRDDLGSRYKRAYDQAILTASDIYTESMADPTGGAFGFFSPNEDEWECIKRAYNNRMIMLPNDCGISDDDFPDLAPIQILVINTVWQHIDGRPSFVFIKSRQNTDYVVVYE